MANKEEFAMCEGCGLIERMAWIMQDKHVCGKITDVDFIPMQDLKLRIGKKKFFHIKPNVNWGTR